MGRDDAIRRGWLHRIATTVCRDELGRFLVYRRAGGLSGYPGYHEVAFGGAVDVGESYQAAASRELAEELGVDVPVREVVTFLCHGEIGSYWLGAGTPVEIWPPTALLRHEPERETIFPSLSRPAGVTLPYAIDLANEGVGERPHRPLMLGELLTPSPSAPVRIAGYRPRWRRPPGGLPGPRRSPVRT
ncbi:NUDIX domain-containing protein [Nonomuraea sp. NPDC003201]